MAFPRLPIPRLALAAALALLCTACVPGVDYTAYDLQVGENEVIVEGDLTGAVLWEEDKVYVLRGFVRVKAGAELTIQPGTVIKGDKETRGSLVVERGGKLLARGTATQPIVFTSRLPAGQRRAGDWGGIIICGRAPVNLAAGEAEVEGGTSAIYGGTDADDNSGVLSYIRIEYPGVAFQPNKEINGLTMAAVGRGTEVNHIMVTDSGDDSFEWFGGTVNCSHLVSYGAADDDFDSDFGYSGLVQFGLVVRVPDRADVSGSNGFESDNDGEGSTNTPQTHPIFSNITVIGPILQAATWNADYKRAAHIRRNSACNIYNSVLAGYPVGLFIDGDATGANAAAGTLNVRNTIIAGCPEALQTNAEGFDIGAWFGTAEWQNSSPASADGLFAPAIGITPIYRPLAGSELLDGASFDATALQAAFFSPVAYRGAMGAEDWTLGWASWSSQNTAY